MLDFTGDVFATGAGLVKLKIMLGSTPVVVMVDAKDDCSLKDDCGCELIEGVVQKSGPWLG